LTERVVFDLWGMAKLISNLFFQNYQLMVLMDGLFWNGNVV